MQTDLEALRDVEKKARSMISLLDARLIHEAIAELEELRELKPKEGTPSTKFFRTCGVCGAKDIPFGFEWPFWKDGNPVHIGCLANK